MLRPVTVFKWNREKVSSGRYEKVKDCEGVFHRWGENYEEFENGPGNYSVAIVELPNGEVITPSADLIKFEDK